MNPIILFILFLIFFVPLSLFFRLIGRDELRLKNNKQSNWVERQEPEVSPESFKNQF